MSYVSIVNYVSSQIDPNGPRSRGRLKKRWLDVVKADMKENKDGCKDGPKKMLKTGQRGG